MRLIEYRIFMPLSLEENNIGQRFSFTEADRLNTGNDQGVVYVKNERFRVPYQQSTTNGATRQVQQSRLPFINDESANKDLVVENEFVNAQSSEYGLYAHKYYKIESKVPALIRKFVPKDMLVVHERAWIMYPLLIKTVISNEYFKSKFRLEMDTTVRECPNGEPEPNVHNLPPELLKKREIISLDITNMSSESNSHHLLKEDENPCKFRSSKTGRGPLRPNGEWIKDCKANNWPLICIYKLVHVEFKVPGFQSLSEGFLRDAYKEMFTTFHRQVFCWMDKWIDLSESDVKKIEDEMIHVLARQISTPSDQDEVNQVQISV